MLHVFNLLSRTYRLYIAAYDKQKLLLSADTGHFSLIRALHLADAITLCNGAFIPL